MINMLSQPSGIHSQLSLSLSLAIHRKLLVLVYEQYKGFPYFTTKGQIWVHLASTQFLLYWWQLLPWKCLSSSPQQEVYYCTVLFVNNWLSPCSWNRSHLLCISTFCSLNLLHDLSKISDQRCPLEQWRVALWIMLSLDDSKEGPLCLIGNVLRCDGFVSYHIYFCTRNKFKEEKEI